MPLQDRAVIVSADMRYIGQHHEVIVSFNAGDLDPADPAGPGRVAALFHSRHEQLYGFSAAGADLEMLSLRVAVVGRTAALDLTETATGSRLKLLPRGAATSTSSRWAGRNRCRFTTGSHFLWDSRL